MNESKSLDDITGTIVDAALHIHIDLGPGLLESVYEAVLARALERRGCVWSVKGSFNSSTMAWFLRRGFVLICS